jgi:hypothetical protein
MRRVIVAPLALAVAALVLPAGAFGKGNPSGQTPKEGKAACLEGGGTWFSSTQTCLTTGGECVSLTGQILSPEQFCRI